MPTAKVPAKKPVIKKATIKKTVAKKSTAHPARHASPGVAGGKPGVHKAAHKAGVQAVHPAPVHAQLAPREKYTFAVGKRKTAIARVRYYELGTGEIVVNGMTPEKYFAFGSWVEQSRYPLVLTGWAKGRWSIKVNGGGTHGQAHATAHGITRVLLLLDPALRPTLKAAGLLTRDSRIKERKKPGLKRARRAPQWQKR